MVATSRGRAFAIRELRRRRKKYAALPAFDNSTLIAGDPCYYRCIACGDPTGVQVPETWITRPEMCAECQALHTLGWLE